MDESWQRSGAPLTSGWTRGFIPGVGAADSFLGRPNQNKSHCVKNLKDIIIHAGILPLMA